MSRRSAEEFFPFASVDRLRFNKDRGFRLGCWLSDGLSAIPYFLSCRERLNCTRGVLAIVKVYVKCFL